MQKTEECYKKGLDMIPHHSRILTACGALCINDGRFELAQELLQRAIQYLQQEEEEEQVGEIEEEDDDDKKDRLGILNNVKTYLTMVESKLHAKNKKQLLLDCSTSSYGGGKQHVEMSNKAQQAIKDVLAERVFVSGEESCSKKGIGRNKTCGNYGLLSLSESSSREDKNYHDNDGKNISSCTEKYHRDHYDSTSKRHKRHFETHKRYKKDKTKKKHKEQHRRKRKRQTSQNLESGSSSSSDEDDGVNQSSICSQSSTNDTDYYHRKRRRSRRKYHKKRRR